VTCVTFGRSGNLPENFHILLGIKTAFHLGGFLTGVNGPG
jgi:hypothetical protein